MIWVTWRQLRGSAAAALGAAALVAALLAITGPRLADNFDDSGLAECVATLDDATCQAIRSELFRDFPYNAMRGLGNVLIAVPALIGVFWGAPLLARELESGTHRLAWTQSVTRGRWLTVKLLVVGGMAVGIAAVFSLLFTWWSGPFDRYESRVGPILFSQRGVVPVAYAVFAVSLGVAAGAVIRRTVPAMAVTLLGFVVVRAGVQTWLRPRLVEPAELTYPTFSFYAPDPAGLENAEQGWVLGRHTTDAAGQRYTADIANSDPAAAEVCGLRLDEVTKEVLDACGERLGLEEVVELHPASHFWSLQMGESAIFVGLAVALLAFGLWWVRRRVA